MTAIEATRQILVLNRQLDAYILDVQVITQFYFRDQTLTLFAKKANRTMGLPCTYTEVCPVDEWSDNLDKRLKLIPSCDRLISLYKL